MTSSLRACLAFFCPAMSLNLTFCPWSTISSIINSISFSSIFGIFNFLFRGTLLGVDEAVVAPERLAALLVGFFTLFIFLFIKLAWLLPELLVGRLLPDTGRTCRLDKFFSNSFTLVVRLVTVVVVGLLVVLAAAPRLAVLSERDFSICCLTKLIKVSWTYFCL